MLLDTGGQGVGGVDIVLDLSSNLTYSSYDASSSVFPMEATAPTVNGSSLHLARLNTTNGGWNGSSGEVIHLVFTVGGAGTSSVAINQTSSSVIEFTTSDDILNTVNNGLYTINSVSTPSSTPTAALIATSTPTSILPSSSTSPVSTKSTTTSSLPVTGTSFWWVGVMILLGIGVWRSNGLSSPK